MKNISGVVFFILILGTRGSFQGSQLHFCPGQPTQITSLPKLRIRIILPDSRQKLGSGFENWMVLYRTAKIIKLTKKSMIIVTYSLLTFLQQLAVNNDHNFVVNFRTFETIFSSLLAKWIRIRLKLIQIRKHWGFFFKHYLQR